MSRQNLVEKEDKFAIGLARIVDLDSHFNLVPFATGQLAQVVSPQDGVVVNFDAAVASCMSVHSKDSIHRVDSQPLQLRISGSTQPRQEFIGKKFVRLRVKDLVRQRRAHDSLTRE